MSRRSYSGLMRQPAWLLYDGDELVASVRARSANEARELFKKAGLQGTMLTRKGKLTRPRD